MMALLASPLSDEACDARLAMTGGSEASRLLSQFPRLTPLRRGV